jgi:hypothetical protein
MRPSWSPPSLPVAPDEMLDGTQDSEWTAVQETHRRDRTIHDLLARSGSARLHARVTTPPAVRRQWRTSERAIVAAERTIRALDPQDPGFWHEFEDRRRALLETFRTASVPLYT